MCILTTSLITTIRKLFYKVFIDSPYQHCQWYSVAFISYRFISIVASDRISSSEAEYYLLCTHPTSPLSPDPWRSLVDSASLCHKWCCHKRRSHILTLFPLDTVIMRLVQYVVILFLLSENHLLDTVPGVPFTLPPQRRLFSFTCLLAVLSQAWNDILFPQCCSHLSAVEPLPASFCLCICAFCETDSSCFIFAERIFFSSLNSSISTDRDIPGYSF